MRARCREQESRGKAEQLRSREPASPARPAEEEGMPEPATVLEEAEGPASACKAAHNDSSVSSASQLLENPSPVSWAFCSPASESEGEFTLKRQRGIRRKRQPSGREALADSKRPRRSGQPLLAEAVNRHVKRLALETDLDSSLVAEELDKPDASLGAEESAVTVCSAFVKHSFNIN